MLPTGWGVAGGARYLIFVRTPTVEKVGDKKLSQWIADLRNSDPSIREEAIVAITFFGPAAAEAVPALLDRLHDSDASPRAKAIVALSSSTK